MAASVKQRLLNLAQSRKTDFNLLQVRYATERLLYRLSVSPYANDFLLKGAMLFILWEHDPHRPTRDMDMLFLAEYDSLKLESLFREIVAIQVPDDGIVFPKDSIQIDDIRENTAYGGIRVKLIGQLGTARVPVQVDIGIGDAVHPEPQWMDFTPLLNFPAPRIRSYPIYSVVAEKFQTMEELRELNSRMKDYYDIFYLLNRFEFSGSDLRQALQLTFQRRRTPLPISLPHALSEVFFRNPQKRMQWEGFLRRNSLKETPGLDTICKQIAAFLVPVLQDEHFNKNWNPDKGWQP